MRIADVLAGAAACVGGVALVVEHMRPDVGGGDVGAWVDAPLQMFPKGVVVGGAGKVQRSDAGKGIVRTTSLNRSRSGYSRSGCRRSHAGLWRVEVLDAGIQVR